MNFEKEKIEWLHYLENIRANTDNRLLDEFAEQQGFGLNGLKHREVLPTFFSGNIFNQGSIVVLSLNPRYNEEKTHDEQGIIDKTPNSASFRIWFDRCLKGFEAPADQMHMVFYNCYKLFKNPAMPLGRRNPDAFAFMSDNVVNVDWCPYYSVTTPTFNTATMDKALRATWNEVLSRILRQVNPRFVFIHGAPFRSWLSDMTDIQLAEPILMKLLPKEKVKLYRGNRIGETEVPVIYLDWFINRANANTNFERIREYLLSEGLLVS